MGRFCRKRNLLLRVQRIRARRPGQGMAPSFTPRAGPLALHAASMAKPYSHSKGACRRDCVAGNRDLALCDTLRGWVHFAINGPRSRRSELPGIWASQSRQPWMAYYFHRRVARLLPGGSAEQIRGDLEQPCGSQCNPHLYSVVVPAIPAICTFGETVEKTRQMATDAIRSFLESAQKAGERFPRHGFGVWDSP